MATSEKFCLRWNDFESNISGAFRELREDKDFFDITIACEDDQVDAHKVILSACSPFFKGVLKKNKHQHPLLYLKGFRFSDLISVLNFMYHGEVNIAQEDLNQFLAAAEDLKIKGLTQNDSATSRTNEEEISKKPISHPSRPMTKSSQKLSYSLSHKNVPDDDDEIQEVLPVIKSEPVVLSTHNLQQPGMDSFSGDSGSASIQTLAENNTDHELAVGEDYVDYDEYENAAFDNSMQMQGMDDANKELDELITSYIHRYDDPLRGSFWQCSVCKKENKNKSHLKRHVESHVSGYAHKCYICTREFKNRESLRIHLYSHKAPK